ncbi:MAG: DnaJ domain-containing protein [Legionellales bacterium]|nr:DnaJ domain-containing protein [Legionellales bacterium]
MNKFQALQLLGLTGSISNEDIKRAYRSKAKEFHPDRNSAGAEIMKMINIAYELVKNEENVTVYDNQIMSEYPEILADALRAILNLGLNIEICGCWVWVDGNTKPHKDILKNAGFKWAVKKAKWYFRPAEKRSRRYGATWSMNEIRTAYGSQIIREDQKKLSTSA